MKIEMGESLMMSWLKHIKGCQFAQLNWKASECWKNKKSYSENKKEAENLFNEITKEYDFFKKSGFQQTITQAEIDVLGYNFDEDKFYAVDVAYHEQGLNYQNLLQKVAMKMVRSALILKLYFNAKNVDIIFASPKVGKKDFNELKKVFAQLNENQAEYGTNFNFLLYANNENDENFTNTLSFKNEILDPLMEKIDDIADTSELFMRSIQLNKLFEKMFKADKDN